MRRAGILLNITSLPSEYGIGGFGTEIDEFASFLAKCSCSLWQTLPLTSIGMGNSPYSGVSAFAGNYLYIDPQKLVNDGYITQDMATNAKYKLSPYTTDYNFAKECKSHLIKAAYANINKAVLADYLSHNSWLNDYAAYMTIKQLHNQLPWWQWDTALANYDKVAVDAFVVKNSDIYGYYVAEQYLFDKQWRDAKSAINGKGVSVVGDMPIYVSLDSADVWSNREQFLLDKNNIPTAVAGVPPDYFAAKGQLWGNPLYDYTVMKKDGYKWFIARMRRMFELYDICRFDHFRALAEYWAVPYGAKDATCGKWEKGGGADLLNHVLAAIKGEIIAEDLGIINEKVTDLRDEFKLKGMRIMQFAFDGDDSTHLPHNYTRNCVAYTGTHDNNTLFGWLYETTVDNKKRLYSYIGAQDGLEGGANSPQVWACIRTVLTSVADYAIIPFQDLLGWGADTRINIPGKPDNNWQIRIASENLRQINNEKLKYLINISKRQ